MNENWTKNYKKAAQGNDYVKLNAGLMKVKDLDNYLSSFPSNLLSFNKTGEFTYYKQLYVILRMLDDIREPDTWATFDIFD